MEGTGDYHGGGGRDVVLGGEGFGVEDEGLKDGLTDVVELFLEAVDVDEGEEEDGVGAVGEFGDS